MAASNRAAQREQAKRKNAVTRAHGQIDRMISQVDQELEQEVKKIAELEEKLRVKPLTAGGITFDPSSGRFNLKKIGDAKGKIVWSAQIGYDLDPACWSPAIVDGARTYQLIALTATRHSVIAAVQVTAIVGGPKSTKLFSKSDTSKNAVFLSVNGVRYQALEGQLDVPLFGPEPAIALVAFPLPNAVCQTVSIDFHFKAAFGQFAIAFSDPNVFLRPMSGPRLAEQVRQMLEKEFHPAKQEAESVKTRIAAKSESSGCLVILIAPIGTILSLIAAGATRASRELAC